MIVFVQLTSAGVDVGPFDIYQWLAPNWVLVESGVSRATLVLGANYTVDDNATIIRLQSSGACDNYLDLVIGTTTTTTSTTEEPGTTTSTTTLEPTTTTTTTTTETPGTTTTTTTLEPTTTTTTTTEDLGTTTTTTSTSSTTTTTTTEAPACVEFTNPIGWDAGSPTAACAAEKVAMFGDVSDFASATTISASAECLVTLGGYYSDGSIWKHTTDGTTFDGSGSCTTTTTTTILSYSYTLGFGNSKVNACTAYGSTPMTVYSATSSFVTGMTLFMDSNLTIPVEAGYTHVVNGTDAFFLVNNNEVGTSDGVC